MEQATDNVWVFMGLGATSPCAVFSTKARAEEWIRKWRVSGMLTAYLLDQSVYEWALAQSYFEPRYPSQKEPAFVQRFTSAYAEHYHYEDGQEPGS